MPSKVPAHSSLFVKKGEDMLKSFFTVAGMDECSYSDVENGDPSGPWTTASPCQSNIYQFFVNFSLANNQQKYCMVIQYIDNCSCLPLKKLTRNLEFSENNINRCKNIIIIGTTSDTNVMLRILKFRAISVRIPVFLGLTLGPQYDGLNLEKHD